MSAKGLPVVRAVDLATTDENHRWLVKDLWAAGGVGMIGGSPKSCKSWLGLEMAVSVATGTDCLGRFSTARAEPLIYLAEDALPVVRERLVALSIHHGCRIDQLDVHVITAPSVRLDRADHFGRLEHTIEQVRPAMLLLDPFVRLHGLDENNAQEVANILGRLRSLQRRYEMAVIVVHHTRKAGSHNRNGMALRGSGDLWAWGDSNLYLSRVGDVLRLNIEHRAAPAPQPLTLALKGSPPHLTVVDASPQLTPNLDDRVLHLLQESEAPLTRTEIRQRLSVNNHRLGLALLQLEQNGALYRTKLGWLRRTGSDRSLS